MTDQLIDFLTSDRIFQSSDVRRDRALLDDEGDARRIVKIDCVGPSSADT